MATYEARRGEVLLHMSHFFMGYLNTLYQKFDGDLAMVIVLGEISHHNTSGIFSPDVKSNEGMTALRTHAKGWNAMPGCNAFSLSCATAIPRETVRRKIAELKKRGWIVDVPKQGLRLTPACADHFGPDFSLNILGRLLKAARTIEHILSTPDAKPSPLPAKRQSASTKSRTKKKKP